MSTRRVLCATAAAAAAALALTGCGPKNSGIAAPPPATAPASAPVAGDSAAPAAPSDQATTPAAPTAANPAVSSSAPLKPGATPCQPDKPVAPGHKVVVADKVATTTTLYAQDGVFDCGKAPDYGWWPKGAEKTYTILPGAKAELAGAEVNKPVTLATLIAHLNTCVTNTGDTSSCGSGKTYDLALDPAGKVSGLTELYSP